MIKHKIGIIGVGRWGTNYLKTLNEFKNADVKWICAKKNSTLKVALSEVDNKSDIKTTKNCKDILKDKDVEAVVVASSGSTHYQFANEVLEANKHVLVEKPLAFTSIEVKKLINISKKKKKILMVGHLHLFNPPIQRLKEDIKKGLFGKINYMHSFGSGNGPARQDMSALWDFFPHDVSIFLYLLDEMPLSVSADGASYLKKGIEDLVAMNIKFANNIFAHSVGTWLYPLKKRELILIGEKLRAAFDDYASNKLRYYDVGNNCITPQLSNSKPLTEQLRHFLNCIENNKIPLTDGMEALKVTTVLEAAQKSLKKKGEMVKIKFA